MTRRRLLPADIGGVAIHAVGRLLKLRQLFFNRSDFRVSGSLVVLVTSSADRNRHIRSKTAQRAGSRDVDVTGRALHDVLALAAFVREHCRLSRRPIDTDKRSGRFVATSTVIASRLEIFPVTVEARVMAVRHRLEWIKH